MLKFRRISFFYASVLMAICQACMASPGIGLTPGVSMPNAFLSQEPAPPASGQDAVQLQPLVQQLDKLLDQERDALEKRSMYLQKQAGMGDPASGGAADSGQPDSATIAQAMAMASQMRQGGGMQGMMMYMQYMASDANRQRMEYWQTRLIRARHALDGAAAWLSQAQKQIKMQECQDVTIGEATIKDSKCMKTATLEYNNKMRALATPYLARVASAIADVLAASKERVDADEQMAAKLNAMKGGPMLQSRVVALHSVAIDAIRNYNEVLRTAVDTAADAENYGKNNQQ